LGTSDLGNFRIDVVGFNFEGLTLGNEVADALQECDVRIVIPGFLAPRDVPLVDLTLKFVSLFEQSPVDG